VGRGQIAVWRDRRDQKRFVRVVAAAAAAAAVNENRALPFLKDECDSPSRSHFARVRRDP